MTSVGPHRDDSLKEIWMQQRIWFIKSENIQFFYERLIRDERIYCIKRTAI